MNTIVYFEVAGPDAEGLAAFYATVVLEMPRAPQPGASPTERGQGERIPE